MIRFQVAILLLGALASGCSRQADVIEITESREAGPAPSIPENASSTARFGFAQLPAGHPRMDGASELPPGHPAIDASMTAATSVAPETASIGWDVPEGWTTGPRKPMRVVTLLSGKNQSVECYIAELGGMGGGVAANLSRWSGQMGQAALSGEDIAGLPKISVLGQRVPLLSVDGDYRGMGGTARVDSTLLGTVVSSGGKTYFVKMVGPREEVEKQRDAFIAFCESLRQSVP